MSNTSEIVSPDANEYSDFGKPYDMYPSVSDPVDCCLPGSFLNCPQVANLGMCPNFMAQRCAAKWDDKCSLYANSIDDRVKFKDFLRDTAGKKYCQLSPDSTCSKMCQPFNPIDQSSAQVCSYVGNEVMKDANATIDIGLYKPVSISPDYMSPCQQTCNLMNPKDITVDDQVINNCLQYGYCNDILTNICQLSKQGNIALQHPGLDTYCSNLKATQTVAVSPSPSPAKERLSYNTSRKEKLEGGVDDTTKIILGVCIAAIVILLLVLLYRKYKKSNSMSRMNRHR